MISSSYSYSLFALKRDYQQQETGIHATNHTKVAFLVGVKADQLEQSDCANLFDIHRTPEEKMQSFENLKKQAGQDYARIFQIVSHSNTTELKINNTIVASWENPTLSPPTTPGKQPAPANNRNDTNIVDNGIIKQKNRVQEQRVNSRQDDVARQDATANILASEIERLGGAGEPHREEKYIAINRLDNEALVRAVNVLDNGEESKSGEPYPSTDEEIKTCTTNACVKEKNKPVQTTAFDDEHSAESTDANDEFIQQIDKAQFEKEFLPDKLNHQIRFTKTATSPLFFPDDPTGKDPTTPAEALHKHFLSEFHSRTEADQEFIRAFINEMDSSDSDDDSIDNGFTDNPPIQTTPGKSAVGESE